MLKIGNLTLDVPFFQASLSGYSDYAMRRLALDYGSPLTFAGVMLSKSILHPKVLKMVQPHENEHPIGAQLLGTDAEVMAQAAKSLVGVGYDLIDLNFACPAPKVLRRKRGGFMLNQPYKVMEIYRRVREAVDCPVMMKLRSSFDESGASREDFWEIASLACKEGIDGLIVHGRSVLKLYKGTADWTVLGELKSRFPGTTIIGSGDLFDADTVTQRRKTTGVDGVTIARGAIGNPWIFRELRAIYEGRPMPSEPTIEEQGGVVRRHFDMLLGLYEPKKAVRYFRKFMVNYCKLHPERRKAQKTLLAAKNKEQLLEGFAQWYPV
jgi:tRNA-dihydrouridine synthase B